jgi:hypothetical protein
MSIDQIRQTRAPRQLLPHTPYVETLERRTLLSMAPPMDGGGGGVGMDHPTPISVSGGQHMPASGMHNLMAALSDVPSGGVAGTRTKDSVTIELSNSGTGIARGPVAMTLFVSTDQTLDSSDTRVRTVVRNVSIRPGKSLAMSVRLDRYPDVADGNCWLLARVSGAAAGTTSTTASATSIHMTTPTVDLSGTFSSMPTTMHHGMHGALVLDMVNNGTATANGLLSVNFGWSATPDSSSRDGLTNVVKRVHLKPGAHCTIRLPDSSVDVPPGSFYMTANIDPTDMFHDSNLANNVVVGATPVLIRSSMGHGN